MSIGSALRRLFGQEAADRPAVDEPLVVGVNALLCVCDEEFCFCTRRVPMPLSLIRDMERAGRRALGLAGRPLFSPERP